MKIRILLISVLITFAGILAYSLVSTELFYYSDLVLGDGHGNGTLIKTECDGSKFNVLNTENGMKFTIMTSREMTGFTGDKIGLHQVFDLFLRL